ncbi:metallophosphoesterase [Candidatus Woesearchaeota archaeon]|nr:metallophosphoesterase [Candidatus Woesearchaeota archaeon]HIJ02596.1 hypothetical protein [Candidatus Woesearchaeota archaeon]HIJ13859.1 hypothetical protein [Candidatus Woesearchaeota archaeon]
MEGLNILFASDMHGNKIQYNKLFDYAAKNSFDLLILGGDITPKDAVNRTPQKQEEFLEKYLFKKILEFTKKSKIKILIILGNDDFRSNEEILKKNQSKGYMYIGQKSTIFEKLSIIGYSYVPITPFKFKDWEKHDLSNKKEDRKDILMEGLVNAGLKKSFKLTDRKDNIETDLNKLAIDKHAVLVSHSPPYNTNLDILIDDRHVGSEALRKIIVEKQPLLVLSGHIHETVRISGKYSDKIGKTICLCTGNDNLSENIALIEIRIKRSKISFKRLII